MTRQQFIARTVRAAERGLGVPPGWWGTWSDITNGTVRVRQTGRLFWHVTRRGVLVSKHDSRSAAIGKAAKL